MKHYTKYLLTYTPSWQTAITASLLAAIPLWLEFGYFFTTGYPYHGDSLSNLFPAWHVRHALTAGQLPLYTDLWYGGEYIPFNPLFKGFYPPAWPLYIPGIPMHLAIKLILAVHYAVTPVVAFYYLNREFPLEIAAPFALAFSIPLAFLNGHYEKVFAWPWFVLLLCQFAYYTRTNANHYRRGLITGAAVGMMLLAGGNYYAFFGVATAAPIFIAVRTWDGVRGAVYGSLVGLPKIVSSILPTMLLGHERPAGGASQTLSEAMAGLAGFWIDASMPAIETQGVFNYSGFAAVGIPICLTAGSVVAAAYLKPAWFSRREHNYLLGVTGIAVLGLLLVSKWPYLYQLPVVDTFRVAGRALVVPAAAALLGAWVALRHLTASRRTLARLLAAVIVMTSPIAGLTVWHTQSPGYNRTTDVGEQVTGMIAGAECGDVWIEGRTQGTRTPMQKPIGYELQKDGIALQAVNYGRIGQHYSTHQNGELTFDVLLVGAKLPTNESQYPLTGGWHLPPRGSIDTSRFRLVETMQTDRGPLYVYTVHGECRPTSQVHS